MTVLVEEGWRGPGRRDGEIVAPGAADNGSHLAADRRAFEHWYFDARLDSGHVVVAMLQARELIRRRPGVEIHLYERRGAGAERALRHPRRSQPCLARGGRRAPAGRR